MRIIGFGHRQRVGKDTAVKFVIPHLRLHHKVSCGRCSFGDCIKEQAYNMFKWAGLQPGIYYENNPQYKDTILPTLGISPRQIWINLGTWGRWISPKIWPELAFSRFTADLALVSDVRTMEDITFIRQFDHILIKISNPRIKPVKDSCDELLENYSWDMTIENNSDLKTFNMNIKQAIDSIMESWV